MQFNQRASGRSDRLITTARAKLVLRMSGGDLRRVLGRNSCAIETVVDGFLRDCRARGLRPATVDTYRWALHGGTVRRWLSETGIHDVRGLDETRVRELLLWLRDNAQLNPHTVDDYRRTWVTFLKWCGDAGHIDAVPKLRRGPLPETERRHLTPDEEQRLLSACAMVRDRVLLRFMIGTGLRLGEVVAVDVADLEEIDGHWLVRVGEHTSKGRRHRRVPLDTPGNSLSDDLALYLRKHRPETTNPALWLSSSPRDGEFGRLSRWGICTVFRRLRQETGVPVHPHMCRHTFATRALAAGVPERSLRQAGGWRNASSLDPYVHARTEQMLSDWARRRD